MVFPMISTAVLTVLQSALYAAFSTLCPNAYMDETLHVPQAQRYCHGDFAHWDAKITTLPGTYILSQFCLLPLKWWIGPEACTVGALRGVNAFVLAPITAVLFAAILTEVHGSSCDEAARAMRVMRLVLMPLHFFFCFLYYTDVASSCLVLLMYYLHQRGRVRLAAAVGGLSILVRQTNIIWVFGLAIHLFSGQGGLIAWAKRLRDALVQGIVLPHAAVGVSFVAFVVWNGSIVVGDKSHHTAILHFAMLPYLAVFVLFFLGPAAWFELLSRLPHVRWRALMEGVVVGLGFAAMTKYSSHAHPFLLADNRHVTFYLWKNLLRKPFIRVLLLPCALGVAAAALRAPSTSKRLLTRCNGIEVGLWMLCCALAVVPTPLLEFRYFIVPTLMAMLHQPLRSVREESFAVLVSASINLVVIVVFLLRPFYSDAWGSEPQRFMW